MMYEEKPGIDFKLCIIYQTEKEEQLVENVKSLYDTDLQVIRAIELVMVKSSI